MDKINLKKFKVVFAGCARDCEQSIQKSLDNFRLYSSLFKESYQIIVENGSKDRTREILKNNQTKNDYYLFEDHLNKLPIRGLRLEKARNIIIDKIKTTSKLKACDLFIVMDLDGSGNYQINQEHITKSIEFLFSREKIGAVFANQLGTYYDMWTLRDDKYCQNDFWVETLQNIVKKVGPKDNISSDILAEVKKNFIEKKTFSFDKSLPPLEVDSAFGGFGIYKMKYVHLNKKKYEGTQNIDLIFRDNTKKKIKFQRCEHVNFNFGLKEQNLKLYILPYLINREYLDVTFPPQAAIKLIINH